MKAILSSFLAKIPLWVRLTIVVALLSGCVVFVSLGIIKYIDDNKIEEAVEETIKDYTGIDIDITPESVETK
jgi:hypothetical protein